MNRSTLLKINEPHMIFRGQPARHSVDSATINLDLRGIDTNNSKVARPNHHNIRLQLHKNPFQINKKWIRKDFNAGYNKEQRDWYFTTFSKEQTEKFREMYYAYMNRKEINVYFFDWFSRHCKKNIIDYPFGIRIELANLEIEASPYKDIKKDLDKSVEKSDIKKLHSQMNYSNTVLEVMTKQLGRIETLNQVENASSSTITKGKPPIKTHI
ncbi:hypothetical protein CR513_02043, partial [Mucuna pruriens]